MTTVSICPREFSERAGLQCFKPCENKSVTHYVNGAAGAITKTNVIVQFRRDFAGTCWETCNDASGNAITGCKISTLRAKSG